MEAALAGMALGLVQDIGSASLLGMNAFTGGICRSRAPDFLGRSVLDIASPSNIIFLSAFSLTEGIAVSLFMQMFYGNVPLPRHVHHATAASGACLPACSALSCCSFMSRKKVMTMLMRRSLLKE